MVFLKEILEFKYFTILLPWQSPSGSFTIFYNNQQHECLSVESSENFDRPEIFSRE